MAEKTYRLFGVRFFPRNLRQSGSLWIILDLLMLLLVSINLLLFAFWWIYGYYRVQHWMAEQMPNVHAELFELYQEFPLIDLIFVSIFIGEFLFRWAVAVYRKTYHRWFFYPFIHWYDLLGSIPFGSFRFLRILRIFAVIYRLQKMRVLDWRATYFYTRFQKYRAIVVEEVSDRVVLNVLGGVQKEIEGGLPVTDRIVREVITPYRPVLTQWISQRLQRVTDAGYQQYRQELETYLDQKIQTAVAQNTEVARLKLIPVAGSQIAQMLESAIQDITHRVVDGILQDIGKEDHVRFMDEVADLVVETILVEDQKPENDGLNQIVQRMVLESLAVVQDQVKVQEWKLREKAIAEGLDWLGPPLPSPEPSTKPTTNSTQS